MSTNFPTTLDSFVNPTTSTPVDAATLNPALKHSTQHIHLNDSVAAIEAKLGVNFSSISTSIDYITNFVLLTTTEYPTGVRRDVQGQPFPTNVIWYADSGAVVKLVEKKYTYDMLKNITKIELFLYDGSSDNNLKRTITDIITRSGPFETSRSRSIT